MQWKNLLRGLLCTALLGGSAASKVSAVTIIPIWDASIAGNPDAAVIERTIRAAIAVYEVNFRDPISVRIVFYDCYGRCFARSDTRYAQFPYVDVLAALQGRAASTDDQTALAHLAYTTNNPVNGNPMVSINLPNARALGFAANPPSGQIDCATYFPMAETQPDAYVGVDMQGYYYLTPTPGGPYCYLFSAVSHEIDEALGIGSVLDHGGPGGCPLNDGDPSPGGAVWPEDLFRYDAAGARSLSPSAAVASYFSIDGVTRLARFSQSGNGADYGDWLPGAAAPQVQDAGCTYQYSPELGVELRVLDVLGYTRSAGSVWAVPADGVLGTGKYFDPFGSIAHAIQLVPVSGTILVRDPGNVPGSMTLTKPMTIRAPGGAVVLGAGS